VNASDEGEDGQTAVRDGGTDPNGMVRGESLDGEDEDADDHKPLSDMSEQPDVAVIAVTHALAAQIFCRGADAHVLDIRPVSTVLASHADGIEDTKAGRVWADHHARWAAQLPRDVTDLWAFVVELGRHFTATAFGISLSKTSCPSVKP
jgi:ParB family chromosome partitioning protein